MTTEPKSLPAGDVRFFDNYVPTLEADQYTITVTQTLNSSDTAHPLSQTFKATQRFSVIAPRFALPPEDVQSVFPPQNASGVFGQNLAHIVLNQRVLPWERLIDDAPKGTPWMALLLLTEDEIIPPVGAITPYALTNPTMAGKYPVTSSSSSIDSLLAPLDPATLGPAVTAIGTDETTCKAITITTAVFEQVAPHMIELPFLAHVRETAAVMEHKTTDQAAGDGWFSVVIGNRFPATSNGKTSGSARNIAHLVSLEGFSSYLSGKPQWPSGKTKVRLASLASWSFISLPEAGDFASLAANLAASPVGSVTVTKGGSGYTGAPTVAITAGGGSGAQAAATIAKGAVTGVTVFQSGSGYTSPPSVTFTGGGGTGATATANLLAQGGDMLRLRLPVTGAAQKPGTPEANVQTALQQGFAALAYDTRVGDATFGWYHGPFVPNPVELFSAAQPFESSAAATIYDPATGTFNLTYATAWETGRLLALAARSQSTSAMALKKSLRKSVNLLRERTRSGAAPALAAGTAQSIETATALNQAIEPRVPSRTFISWIGSDLGKRIPRPGLRALTPQKTEVAPASPRTSAAVDLRSMAANPAVTAVLTMRLTAALGEPQFAVALDWLAGLRLLETVPFNALAPNAAMLPAESIRFFYVDPNYLNALTDGANSIGVQTRRDKTQNLALRAPLRQAAVARAHALRARRIGKAVAVSPSSDPADPVAGFLLRSALVSGWPGLEVKAYGAIQKSDPLSPDMTTLIPPLRMERLAPDCLLCLYAKVPVWIELDEPKEGLAFGVEDPATIGDPPRVALRYLEAGANMGKTTGKAVNFDPSQLRTAASRVVNIDSWQKYLAGEVPPSSTVWGPAAFAIQMVRAPEQMIFQTQPNPAPPENAYHGE